MCEQALSCFSLSIKIANTYLTSHMKLLQIKNLVIV